MTRTLRPVCRQLGERLQHRRFHTGGHGIAHDAQGRGSLGQHFRDDRLRAAAGKRRLPRQHLVRHRTERIDVAACIERALTHRLLGTHVLRRAEREPRLCHAGAAGALHGERNAEICNDRRAILQQNVFRFDVAVNDPLPVRVLERARDFTCDAQRVGDRELTLAF